MVFFLQTAYTYIRVNAVPKLCNKTTLWFQVFYLQFANDHQVRTKRSTAFMCLRLPHNKNMQTKPHKSFVAQRIVYTKI